MNRRLSDVAQKVGVSEATVSRVLNGRPGVSETTRLSVLTALDVLGYERPTKMRGERHRLIGLVLAELQNPVFPAFAEVVGTSLWQQRFTSVLCPQSPGGIDEAEYVELLLSQHVSGIVFAGGHYSRAGASHEHYDLLAERQLPVVLLDAAIAELPFPRVTCDNEVATEQALNHLAELGHTRIGIVLGPRDHVPGRLKLAAARAWAERTGLDLPDGRIAHAISYSRESGQAAAAKLLQQGVTGLVCASDPFALGAIRAARRIGLTVPGDVSVVGYDDSPLMTAVDPPLTTVRQPIEAMGLAAARLVVEQIEDHHPAVDEMVFEPELVVRASTARPPVGRPS